MSVQRLSQTHEPAVAAILRADPVQNLFLLGFLDASSLSRGFWYGTIEQGQVTSVALVLPSRLAVPWSPDPRDAADIGRHLRGRHPPSMLVGPRAATDALWDAWSAGEVAPDRFYDQRLYVCRTPPPGPSVAGFRKAHLGEWEIVAANAGRMEAEDLGRNPADDFPELHEQVVRDRIRNGKTWVIERERRILFQINVGTATAVGCQVGGTWVPPDARGQGLATDGMKELCRRLLPKHPMVTLHVNEANSPAVRVYEKAGFDRDAPFRLITVRPP